MSMAPKAAVDERDGKAARDAWLAAGGDAIWLPYSQMKTAPTPLMAAATEGSRIRLADGRELVDGIASWWTACHGYNHPAIAEAVRRQLAAMPHVMFGGLNHAPALTLARRLADLLPGDLERVFFVDSGSVAVEVALKMAVQYWLNQGVRGRTKFVAFRGGYHGDTLATMSICDPDEGMHAHFQGWLPEQIILDLPVDAERRLILDHVLSQRRDEIAGVIIEPLVQGAGGMRMHEPEMLAEIARTVCRRGHLLILDEVMTGFGRTGSMFACDQADIVPDIICLSKALTGGTMALAATVARRHVFEAFWSERAEAALMHGPTFMANPLACAAANASLDLFASEPRLDQVRRIEAALEAGLAPARAIDGVVDVRVKGAIGVVQLSDLKDRAWLRERFLARGVWVRPFADILYLTPAFTIDDADLARLTNAVVEVAREWSGGLR